MKTNRTNDMEASTPIGGSSTTPAQVRARLALAVAMASAALWIGQAFIPAVLWAGVVAVAVDPIRIRLNRRFPHRNTTIAASLVATIALLVVVPLGLAATRAVLEAHALSAWYAGAREHGIPVPTWIRALPIGAAQATTWWNTHLVTAAGAAEQMARIDTAAVIARSRSIGHTLAERIIVFGFSLVVTFFLVRDRNTVVSQLDRAARRAFGDTGPRLGRQILGGVRGAVDGLVLLGLAQAVVMCVIFAIARVPHPILFGALAGLASVIPFGLIAVLLAAGALLSAAGSVAAAIAVIAIGSVINFCIDHFVRPGLIGGSTQLPFVWVLIGIVGGVETIGLLGLFVGPAVMAALVMIWREWVGEEAVTTTDSEETMS